MNANPNQLALAVAAGVPAQTVKISKSTAMKTAWALRKEAAVRLGCRVHEVLMAVCLKMAYRLETFLGETKVGTKLKGFEFRKAVKDAIGYSDETMKKITIRETNTQKRVDGKLLKKCFISLEKLGKEGSSSDIEEVWLEEVVLENDCETYVLSEHAEKIASAMKRHRCGCSATIAMAIGIEYSTDFIELLK